jgi:glycosyltransferase involved in cell wall biosynthesis
MHVVLTVNTSWNVVNFRHSLIQALQSDGHQITVLAPVDEHVETLRSMGCHYIPLEMDLKGLSPVRDLRLMVRMRKTFQQEQPDIVLSFTIKNNIYGALAARSLGVEFLPNVTGLGTAFLSNGVLRRGVEGLYRLAFRKLPVVFFQNSDDRAWFVERKLIGKEQAQLLPGSGIDLEKFSYSPRSRQSQGQSFLLIARLLRDKGIHEYIEAARIVRSHYPSAHFQILGATGNENRTAIDRNTVDDWVRQGVVEYLGTTGDVRPFIRAADCVVLPSYREGMPRTLLESAAIGRPLIATDVAGCRSVVEDMENGYLCRPRDAKDLAAKMCKMIELEPDERLSMGRYGRQKIEREYDQDIVIEAYRRAIEKITAE